MVINVIVFQPTLFHHCLKSGTLSLWGQGGWEAPPFNYPSVILAPWLSLPVTLVLQNWRLAGNGRQRKMRPCRPRGPAAVRPHQQLRELGRGGGEEEAEAKTTKPSKSPGAERPLSLS